MNQPSVNLEQTLPSTTDCEGITVVGRTHQGMVRLNNEDTFGAFTDIGLFAVCDGMGGHAAGEVASDLALRSFFHSVFESRHSLGPDADPSLRHQRNAVVSAIHRAHQAVKLRAKENPDLAGMGTTIAALQIHPEGMVISHVGDSRVYRWRARGGLRQLTRDHSLSNALLDKGRISAEQAQECKNVLVNAVGVTACTPETTTVERCKGDVYLLCSDGLTDLIDAPTIEGIVSEHGMSLERAAQALIAAANEAGGHDNITVLLIRDEVGAEDASDAKITPLMGSRSAREGVDTHLGWVRTAMGPLSRWRRGHRPDSVAV
jgi:serine/threonine protein phosphatase PrpC